ILNMVNETKRQLSAIAIVPALVRIDQFGILDAALTHPLKSQVQFRFLTELTAQNLEGAKTFLKRIPATGIDLKGRTPELGLRLYPQMVVRDEEEAVLFMKSQSDLPILEQDNICLWTNCKSLVLAFSAMFEESWSKATDMQKKISEIENGKPTSKTYVINDAAEARKKYIETLNAAQKEILMITSSEGLTALSKGMVPLVEWRNRGVLVKIMAPITGENSKAAKILSEFCEVRHVSTSYLDSTIIDGQHLFQFKIASPGQEQIVSAPFFEDTFYTSDIGHVEKTEKLFNDLWENAQVPSAVSLESVMNPPETKDVSLSEGTIPRITKKIKAINVKNEVQNKITEKEVINKLINAQRSPEIAPSNGIVRQYGSFGQAIIHTLASFNLPDMLFHILHYEKHSTYGAVDAVGVCLWRETPKGNFFDPVAWVYDNPRSSRFWKEVLDKPLAQNIQLVKKDELQVRVHGNIFFCGWTVEIPLLPPPQRLKPSCITLEGYGNVKTGSFTVNHPSGFKTIHEQNGFEAFVTFLSPESKYSGPGTDGFIAREIISTNYPPDRNQKIKI
ncbi:MAG TPA: hypothetical protein VEF91_03325, partial [Verrucomicrobiae bacterium]|nr:hypothetical protein [Verrucomicrobiae bacterium]